MINFIRFRRFHMQIFV